MPERRILAIGGGEIKNGDTLAIDAYIADEAKKQSGERRACGLFLPTASHDCMPYYNTFHKVYTGKFGLKTDVALTVGRAWDKDKMRDKFSRADFLYVGGGNTVFMLEHWKKCGLLPLIEEFYRAGKLVCGLSAGAICWFEDMYSDSAEEGKYAMWKGLGWIKDKISPHYDQRMLDFDSVLLYNRACAWGLENNAMLEFSNETPVRSVCCGGRVWRLDASDGVIVKKTVF